MTDDQNVPSAEDEQYQAELEDAKAKIAAMTPEGYVELTHYITALEDQASLNEAGGIAFCELWSDKGTRINVTARAVSPIVALENLGRAVRFAETHMRLRTTQQVQPAPQPAPKPAVQPAPQPSIVNMQPLAQPQATVAPQPQYVPVGSQDAQAYRVAHILHDISTNGNHYLKVVTAPGTPYGSYGVTAWPESFPQGFDITAYEYKKPTEPPAEMAYAVIGKFVDKKGVERNKVFSFSATP